MKSIKWLNENEIIDFDYSWTYLSKSKKHKIKQDNFQLLINLIIFTLKQIVKNFYCIFKIERIKIKTVFYYNSINQYNALLPIKNNLNNSLFVGTSHLAANKIPTTIGCLLSFVYLPHFNSKKVIKQKL